MNKVELTPIEEEIMSEISKSGEFLWDCDPFNEKKYDDALKNLYWMDLIVRKPTYGNVFVATPMGKLVIDHNEVADFLNK